ncbi:hypothetical protein VKI22_01770 [Cyanobacterium aponinum UTEX 3221]|uniref:hypothetical protein n=1 Tax=Cyanobacterium aponinum TaxID=379064 RepID=UPI001680315A|nr:hypothetical protein [Cyanobacterium aponinum]MBD2394298.1 hypothetical protein [Cyanobacterium aponinum FACHB-4101]WRL38852.1 hypothetical protein VKI22_01770 [Cyanobacterium aponinum UTEX 3221]
MKHESGNSDGICDVEDIYLSSQDEQLVSFLQTHCPPPPEELKPCEDLIMMSILTEKQQPQKNKQWRWFILPSAILTTILLVSAYIFKPNFSPQMASDHDEEIEAFMINSWQGSMALSE